jgi:pyruvate formate lyase activating enzyme
MVGQYYSADQLVEILLCDRIFYETSKGGVTFSGGEPALHMDYLSYVMKRLKAEDIHIALETAGTFPINHFEKKLLRYIDLIYFDLKLMDPRQHQRFTGRTNKRILNNFQRLVKSPRVQVIPRIPLIPGITATGTNLTHIAQFLDTSGSSPGELLPYNPGGLAKREMVGHPIPDILPIKMMSQEMERNCRTFFDDLLKISAPTE